MSVDQAKIAKIVEKYKSGILTSDELGRVEELIRRGVISVDVNPFYLYSPLYIPLLLIVIFVILMIKKKIRTGWARLATFLSIMWVFFCSFIVFLETPSISTSYPSAIDQIKENIVNGALSCLIPITLLFFIFWSIGWIKEGFKKGNT